MLRYVIRRTVWMLITLFGVTVLVFLLGRLLPMPELATGHGEPDIITDHTARQWYARRYGLDRPLHEQYAQWWRDLFVVERDVLLWTDDAPARPVYRATDRDMLVARDADGRWRRFDVQSRSPAMSAQVPRVQAVLSAEDQLRLLQRWRESDRAPLHRFATGSMGPMVHINDAQRATDRVERFSVTLGTSRLTQNTVMDEIKRRLPVTLTIGVLSLGLTYLLAVPLGIVAAVRQGRPVDRVIHGTTMLAWSLPMVVSGTLLLGVLGGGVVQWFPSGGASTYGAETWALWPWLADRLWHVALPVVVLTLASTGYVTRHVRSAVAEQLDSDYVRTARAKGLTQRAVITRHVLRNSAIPVITLLATVLPVLIGGSIIVETVFGIEGMGRLVYRAALNRDYDVVQAFTLIAAAANVVGLLLGDLACVLIDPRIRLERGAM